MTSIRSWTVHERQALVEHPLLRLERRRLRPEKGNPAAGTAPAGTVASAETGSDERDAVVIDTADWVNIIPLREVSGRTNVVLIRQWRYATAAVSLEIPGGMIDPGEDDRTAAGRELHEETGFRAHRLSDSVGSSPTRRSSPTAASPTWPPSSSGPDHRRVTGPRRSKCSRCRSRRFRP